MQYNREKFFNNYRKIFGKLTQSQVEGLEFLLHRLENSERIESNEKRAYTLASVKWETADTFQPVTEYGSEKYLKSKPYYPYIGEGYIQLTWIDNYRKFGKALGIDLVKYPKMASEPETAWLILEIGMTDDKYGVQDADFTAWTLEDFFDEGKCDFYNARKIINPKDYKSYQPIADSAEKFLSILNISREEEIELDYTEEAFTNPIPEEQPETYYSFFDWIRRKLGLA